MPNTTPSGHSFGWQRERPDYRDKLYSVHAPTEAPPALPSAVNLSALLCEVYNQFEIGACVEHACSTMIRFVLRKMGLADYSPSRLFYYYEARAMEGWQAVDSGSFIRDAIKLDATEGVPPESDWPYVPAKYAVKPPDQAYADASAHEATVYLSINNTNLDEMKTCLAAGYVFVIGFSVYQNFEDGQTAATGEAQMPAGQALGGHAVCVYGYDDATQRFLCRNSWGMWGNQGNFTIPYAYFTNPNLADDAWTIRMMSGPVPPPPPPPLLPIIDSDTFYRKKNGKLFVFTENATFNSIVAVDGVLLKMAINTPFDGEFASDKHLGLTSGPHVVIVANSDGATSLPLTINVP
jgi:hypothetical protein